MNSFFDYQFNYCQLVWMCRSRRNNILHRNIQVLVTEMYKMKSGYTPKIFSDLFDQKEISPYNFRRHPEFRVPLTRTVYHGGESISYLGAKIWAILPT